MPKPETMAAELTVSGPGPHVLRHLGNEWRRGSSLNAWPQGLRVVRFRRNNSLTGPDSRCMQKG
jgi:hypothetical protein